MDLKVKKGERRTIHARTQAIESMVLAGSPTVDGTVWYA